MMEALIYRLGWALVHFVWQGTAVALVLALALAMLRRRSANARYLAATIALLLLAAAPLVTFAMIPAPVPASENAAPPVSSEPPQQTAPFAVGAPAPATQHAHEPIIAEAPNIAPGQRNAPPSQTVAAPPAPGSAPAATNPPAPKLAQDEQDVAVSETLPDAVIERAFPWLVAGWLAGVAMLALRLLAGWLWLHRSLTRDTVPVTQANFTALLADLSDRLGLHKQVQMLESALVQTPLVIGWLRPVILLPVSALTGLSVPQWEAVLAHELAHIRRHDYLINLVQSVIETLLFYHPAVWWVSRCMRQERENCCDDVAVSLCGDRVTYARALTELEQMRQSPIPATAAVAATGGVLMNRIRRLIGLPETPRHRTRSWVAGLIVLAGLVMAGAGTFMLSLPTPSEAGNPADVDTTLPNAGTEKKVVPAEDRQDPEDPETKKLHDLIEQSDRIVVAEVEGKTDPLQLVFQQTLKGQHRETRWPAEDKALAQALQLQFKERKWILFLRCDDGAQSWSTLAPVSAQGWFRPHSEELVKKIVTVAADGFTWSQESKGLRLGLRARHKECQPGKDIVVEVAVQNVGKESLTIRQQRYNIYDYWPNLQFEVTDPQGKKWTLAKFVGPIDEADWPSPRTLAAGEIYVHAVRLEQWPVEEPGKWGGAGVERYQFAEPGTYQVHAVYQNDELTKWFQWAGKLTAGPVTIKVADPAKGKDNAQTQLQDLINQADRIVVVEEKGPFNLKLQGLLKGPRQSEEVPANDALRLAMAASPPQKWVLFLKADEHTHGWAGLTPIHAKNWFLPHTAELEKQIDKELIADFDWGQPSKGLVFGLRLRPMGQATYLPGQPIMADVALRNVGNVALKILELRYNIYDYWPDLTFEVTYPDGRKWTLAKPEGPIKESDSPSPRTLQPGEVYVHSVRLDQWPVLDPETPLSSKVTTFTQQGQYQVRAIYQNQLRPKGYHDAGKLVSNQVKIGVKEDKTQRALHTIKADPEKFGFQLTWHGKPKIKDQIEFRSLWLFTFPVGDVKHNAQTVERFPAADLIKVAEFLASEGFFERAQEITHDEYWQQKFEGYSWTVTSEAANLKPRWFEKLDWNPAVLKKQHALRAVLKGEAAAKMDTILKEWQPAPQQAQPSAKTQQILDAIQKNPAAFSFLVKYHGKDKVVQRSLWLFATPIPAIHLPARLVHPVPKEQIKTLLDFLVKDGFFDRAKLVTYEESCQQQEGYSWQVQGATKDKIVYASLGWDASTFNKLDALRAVLKEQAAKEMDEVLKELAPLRKEMQPVAGPKPAQTEKTKKAVEHLKKDLDKFLFTLWPKGNLHQEQGFKHLTLSRVPPNAKPPDVVLYEQINAEQANRIIDHLADDGFFDRAVDFNQFPKDFEFGPSQKETTYAIVVTTNKGPRYYEKYQLDKALIDRLKKLQHVANRSENQFKTANPEWIAFQKILDHLDAWDKTKKAVDAIKKTSKKVSFEMHCTIARDARDGEAKSVWLSHGLPPFITLGARAVGLEDEGFHQLIDFLAKDGFFARAKEVTMKEASQVPVQGYSLRLFGLYEEKILHDTLTLDRDGMKKLDSYRQVFKGKPSVFDLMYKEWEPLRQTWQEIDDGIQAVKKNPEKFSLLVRFHGDARFPYRSVWLHGGPLPPKADVPFVAHHVKLSPKVVSRLADYLAQQSFVQYAETDPGSNGYPAGPNYTLHVHGIGPKALYQRLDWNPNMLSVLADLEWFLDGDARKEFELLRKELKPLADKWQSAVGTQSAQKFAPPLVVMPKPRLVKVEMSFDQKLIALGQPNKLTLTYTNIDIVPVYIHVNADPTFHDYDNQGEILIAKKPGVAFWFQLNTRGSFGPPKKLEPGEKWMRVVDDVAAIATPAVDGFVPQVFRKKFITEPGTWQIEIRPFKVSKQPAAEFGDTECDVVKLTLTAPVQNPQQKKKQQLQQLAQAKR